MIKVAEIRLGNEHGRVRGKLHLHQMGRVGQIDAGRTSEQSIGRLRVDDQSVRGVVLAHGEGSVDGARCGGEGNHALRVHATDGEHVFGAAASDAGRAQRFGGVEAEQLVGGPEQSGVGLSAVIGEHGGWKDLLQRHDAELVGQRDARCHERHHAGRAGGIGGKRRREERSRSATMADSGRRRSGGRRRGVSCGLPDGADHMIGRHLGHDVAG